MIVLFHLLASLRLRWMDRRRLNQDLWDPKLWCCGGAFFSKARQGLSFDPPCYMQRYASVAAVISDEANNGSIRKVVDFGCAELSFLTALKRLKGVEEVIGVDIDEEVLKKNLCKVELTLSDNLYWMRSSPLLVRVCQGSVDQYDPLLEGTDVVVAIELVEHLYQDTLSRLPANVFGRIAPRVVIVTTPNEEFNVLFPGFTGMRHPDHKFEWTRKQFETWAVNIVENYPDYSVRLYGIGTGPDGSEHLGCCSQMAVFRRTTPSRPPVDLATDDESYTILREVEFPYLVDPRTLEEKVEQDVKLKLHIVQRYHDPYAEQLPLKDFMCYVEEYCNSCDALRDILVARGWKVTGSGDDALLTIPVEDSPSISDEFSEGEYALDENVLGEFDISQPNTEHTWYNPMDDWEPDPEDVEDWAPPEPPKNQSESSTSNYDGRYDDPCPEDDPSDWWYTPPVPPSTTNKILSEQSSATKETLSGVHVSAVRHCLNDIVTVLSRNSDEEFGENWKEPKLPLDDGTMNWDPAKDPGDCFYERKEVVRQNYFRDATRDVEQCWESNDCVNGAKNNCDSSPAKSLAEIFLEDWDTEHNCEQDFVNSAGSNSQSKSCFSGINSETIRAESEPYWSSECLRTNGDSQPEESSVLKTETSELKDDPSYEIMKSYTSVTPLCIENGNSHPKLFENPLYQGAKTCEASCDPSYQRADTNELRQSDDTSEPKQSDGPLYQRVSSDQKQSDDFPYQPDDISVVKQCDHPPHQGADTPKLKQSDDPPYQGTLNSTDIEQSYYQADTPEVKQCDDPLYQEASMLEHEAVALTVSHWGLHNVDQGDSSDWCNGNGLGATPTPSPSRQPLAKSCSLDSCLGNINCRPPPQHMYLSMHGERFGRARTPSEKGPDSGCPASASLDLSDGTSDDSLSGEEGGAPPPLPPLPPLPPPLPVENGDVANNNRDGSSSIRVKGDKPSN